MNNDKYLLPRVFNEILIKEFGKTIPELRKIVDESKILLTNDIIEKFFEFKLKNENPGLRQRILNRKFMIDRSKKSIKQQLQDDIDIKRYTYNGSTLKYYQKYIYCLKRKINNFFSLINSLETNNEIRDFNMEIYDISIDEYGRINEKDVIRIIEPLIYNLKLLEKKVSMANSLQNYFDNPIIEDKVLENIYPSTELQNKKNLNDDSLSHINLTKKQKNKIMSKHNHINSLGLK